MFSQEFLSPEELDQKIRELAEEGYKPYYLYTEPYKGESLEGRGIPLGVLEDYCEFSLAKQKEEVKFRKTPDTFKRKTDKPYVMYTSKIL